MESTVTEVLSSMRKATDRFFDTEAVDDFEPLLQYFAVIETTANQKFQAELSLLNQALTELPGRCTGQYPNAFVSDFGVVSMLGLIDAKLSLVTQYRSTLRDLLTQWELSGPSKRSGVLEQLTHLTAVIERDQNVVSKKGMTRNEDLFIELLKERKEGSSSAFKLELSAFNKTQLESVISGYRNTSMISLRLDPCKRNDVEVLELVAMCLEGLSKKLTLCVYTLRLVREYFTSAKGL